MKLLKIIKYSLKDLIKTRWMYFYTAFLSIFCLTLFLLNDNISAIVTNLMLLVVYLSPLVSTIFGVIYFYNSREFILLLLGQPIKRFDIILGLYLSFNITFFVAFILGLSIPLIIFGNSTIFFSSQLLSVIVIYLSLTLIFSGISLFLTTLIDNKIRGFGFAIFIWLLLTIVYDSLMLIAIFYYSDYPLEYFLITTTLFNPVDLSRIILTLQSDSALLMGFTGALFSKFFGNQLGVTLSSLAIIIWILIPLFLSVKLFNKKDF